PVQTNGVHRALEPRHMAVVVGAPNIDDALPIVLAIHSSGRKDRAQGKENSEKLCGAVESLKDSIDRMDTRIEILETHAQEDHRRLLVMEILEEKLPIEERLR
ncbi:hypothetical protein, partial [Anaerotruncus colihominis]|uniref:hypothetical protein n=1 Tax=Anaerotruncus colihominis TaxID=169435 RepID=UPI00210ED04A